LELRIEDVAFGGKGVARANGKAIFIPYTIDGERVSARIGREKKNFADAEMDEVLEPSSHRVPPECPYFGRCGGCSYQHMRYEHQLELKSRQVEQTLKRIGGLHEIPIHPIVASPQSYHYRNRITVHCDNDTIGFYRRGEHRLIDVEQCPIAMPEVNDELKRLRARRPRDGHYTLRADSGHRIFSQTNDAVAEQLLEHVAGLIPKRGALLIDAYCGAGFFTKHLLDKFERVIGIDWDKFAIEAAKQNASEKETYIAGDVDFELAQVGAVHRTPNAFGVGSIAPTFGEGTTLIVDPPATGLTSAGPQTIAELAPATLIYVSCNPPTLARDLAKLRDRFTIESVTPFDMFPQTAEIEVAVKLTARSS
jgi:tRNA/tmRNA/rRNA uracil-C5-methylase (TrmA/RlmC/RlmD family)